MISETTSKQNCTLKQEIANPWFQLYEPRLTNKKGGDSKPMSYSGPFSCLSRFKVSSLIKLYIHFYTWHTKSNKMVEYMKGMSFKRKILVEIKGKAQKGELYCALGS